MALGLLGFSFKALLYHLIFLQARYIDWTFTTPLLLMDVLLIAGVPFGTLLW